MCRLMFILNIGLKFPKNDEHKLNNPQTPPLDPRIAHACTHNEEHFLVPSEGEYTSLMTSLVFLIILWGMFFGSSIEYVYCYVDGF